MIKRIKDLTEADKKRYLQSIKREIEGSGQSGEFYVIRGQTQSTEYQERR